MILSLSRLLARPLTLPTFFLPAYAVIFTWAFFSGPLSAVDTVKDLRSAFGVAVRASTLVRATGSSHTDCQMPEAAV